MLTKAAVIWSKGFFNEQKVQKNNIIISNINIL